MPGHATTTVAATCSARWPAPGCAPYSARAATAAEWLAMV